MGRGPSLSPTKPNVNMVLSGDSYVVILRLLRKRFACSLFNENLIYEF